MIDIQWDPCWSRVVGELLQGRSLCTGTGEGCTGEVTCEPGMGQKALWEAARAKARKEDRFQEPADTRCNCILGRINE